MQLPIVQTVQQPGEADLLRLFGRTELHWTQHLAEETQLDCGTAFTNPELDQVFDANNMLDAQVPPDGSVEEAFEETKRHFEEKGTRCYRWVMNLSAPPEQTKPLVERLLEQKYEPLGVDVMYLRHMPPLPQPEQGDLKIIPARASYRHARQLAEASAQRWNTPQLVEATLLHLDDPSWEALLALRDGQAVAGAGVLSSGEIGRIDDVFVAEPFRRQGLGRIMVQRCLEICARSVFRHVFLSVLPDNAPAIALYRQLGFETIGQITAYYAPGTRPRP